LSGRRPAPVAGGRLRLASHEAARHRRAPADPGARPSLPGGKGVLPV